ncbi:MAG: amino acid racemase [Oscillospiraceae bacterium]|nr:amino acid racemase [Oscillospiraceae bacterium]
MYKKLGILGGMGPLATYTLYKNIIEGTHAQKDQDNIKMLISNASDIPDRTEGILHGGESPLPYLLNELKILENAGCDLIAIPCNTSHYFYDALQNNCNVRILNMIDLTAERLENLGVKRCYLMATEGIIKTGVYQKSMSRRNIETILPTDDEIKEMMHIIYDGVKAGKILDTTNLCNIAQKYLNLGCEKIILGCTEFSTEKGQIVGLDKSVTVDAMEVLKDKILESVGVKQDI